MTLIRRYIHKAAITAAGILMCVLIVGASAQAGPAIEIGEDAFNFGRISQHAVVSHRFTISSVGDDTLRITKIVTGCFCTKAPLEDSVLAPGEQTTLELFFSTKSYRGYVNKTTYLETNIGQAKEYIKISSELLPQPDTIMPIHLSPARLDVSQFKPKPRTKARFYIHNKDSVDYRITLIDHADHVFDVKLPEIVKAHDSAWGGIIVHDDAIKTEFEHSLTFEINDANRTRYTLPVKRMYRVKK